MIPPIETAMVNDIRRQRYRELALEKAQDAFKAARGEQCPNSCGSSRT